MEIRFSEDASPRSLQALTTELADRPDVASILILGCDDNGWRPEEIDPILKTCAVPVFGGIFPKVVYGPEAYDRGLVVVGMPWPADVDCIFGLSAAEAVYEVALASFAERNGGVPGTVMVFVDGLSQRIGALVEIMFDRMGLKHNFVGGGAGSLSFQQAPCVLTPNGMVADAAILAWMPIRSGIGVTHGWHVASECLKATETKRNTLKTLDWERAAERYRELVEAHSGLCFRDHAFFDIAKGYPFGIQRLGGELVVRDPLSIDGAGGLICVGEIPEGSFLYLLNGTPESLISAAGRAREQALEGLPEAQNRSAVLVMDCISRALFLGPDLNEELTTLAGDSTLFGAMTLGEIANSGRDYLEFYNKTTVVALLNTG